MPCVNFNLPPDYGGRLKRSSSQQDGATTDVLDRDDALLLLDGQADDQLKILLDV